MSKKALFAQALTKARSEAEFSSATALAEKIGVSQTLISKLENSKDAKQPTLAFMNKVLPELTPEGQEKVLAAFFTGFPNVLEALERPEEEPEIDDTHPEVRAILEHLARLSSDNKECLNYLLTMGRIAFRKQELSHQADGQSVKRIRTLFVLFAEFMKHSPGVAQNEWDQLDKISRSNS